MYLLSGRTGSKHLNVQNSIENPKDLHPLICFGVSHSGLVSNPKSRYNSRLSEMYSTYPFGPSYKLLTPGEGLLVLKHRDISRDLFDSLDYTAFDCVVRRLDSIPVIPHEIDHSSDQLLHLAAHEFSGSRYSICASVEGAGSQFLFLFR